MAGRARFRRLVPAQQGHAAGVTTAPTIVARVGGRVTTTLTTEQVPLTVTEILDLAKAALAQAAATTEDATSAPTVDAEDPPIATAQDATVTADPRRCCRAGP